MENKTKLTASSVMGELSKLYCAIPYSLLQKGAGIVMNKNTWRLVVFAYGSIHPNVNYPINYYGLPIHVDDRYPDDMMVVMSLDEIEAIKEADEFFRNDPLDLVGP